MALKELGFESYVGPVLESAEDFRKTMAVSLCVMLLFALVVSTGVFLKGPGLDGTGEVIGAETDVVVEEYE